ncbi:hypothetical protein HDU91_005922 [Kappamyces sp. JEL0680]|nr:hypothetical protein HDU91_005922 [Kappamyces sp. JEL0680]
MGSWAVVSNDAGCNNGALTCPSSCGCGNADTGENNCSFPDLDHSNANVQQLVKDYVAYARDTLGITGYRWDEAKGFAPAYFELYNDYGKPAFAVAEFYDGSLAKVQAWLSGSHLKIPAFDFPLYFILQRCVRANDYTEMQGVKTVVAWNSSLAVTFTANHDTYRAGTFGANSAQDIQGYAYILTHPGVPCVFWADYTSATTQGIIVQLMALRKEIGVAAASTFTISQAGSGIYAAYIKGANGRMLALALGTASWTPSNPSYQLRLTGTNFKVWSL